MSHSVFRDFDEDIEQIDGNVKSEVAEQNLVVFINKDGDVTVDPHALQDLIGKFQYVFHFDQLKIE